MNRMGIFLGLQKLKILLGVLEFPDPFLGGGGGGRRGVKKMLGPSLRIRKP